MLAPRASSAFVCIRCELKLARPRLPAISNRTSRATFSTSPRRHEAQEASSDRPPYQFPDRKPRGELIERPLGRLRKRKGKAPIRETTARLGGGLKSLGDDAKILVLREEGDAPPEETPEPHFDTREPVDIIASLKQEESAIGQDDVDSLLESLRPKTHAPANEPQYISQVAFLKLSNMLVESFTHPQLARYYISQRESDRTSNLDKSAKPTEPGIAKKPIDRTEWHPGTTQITKRLSTIHSARGIKQKSKSFLVDQILRFAWNVIQLEEIEAPGEIEITLQSWQLHLLTLSDPTSLDQIGRKRMAKIEIHSSERKHSKDYQTHESHVLRITADKNTAEYTADDVQAVLKNTETGRFSLEPWLPFMVEDTVHKDSTAHRLSSEGLATVGKLSETYIRVVSPHMLLIRGLNKASVEQAKRGILQMIPLKGPARHIDRRRLDTAQKESYLIPTAFKNFLSYRYRNMNLGRWSFPVPKTASEDSPALHHASKSEVAENVGDRFTVRIVKTLKASQKMKNLVHKKGQGYTIYNKISAEFGQVLVPLDARYKTSSALSAPFSHTFPGLSNLLMDEAFSSEAYAASPILEYEFVANPAQAAPLKGDERHPDLVMKFRYQQGSKPTLVSIAYKIEESFYDVLLPDRAVDVRFRVSQELVYANTDVMRQETNIRDFIDAVVANIESGERLTAPFKLTVSVPKFAIPGYDATATGNRSLEYFFTGIRYRQTVSTTYQDQPVSYSTTRAGKLGKKGGTLSTSYHFKKDSKPLKNFVTTTFKIADLLTDASGNAKAMSKTVRPRDQTSVRRQKRRGMAKGEVDGQDPEDHKEHSSRNDDYEQMPRNDLEVEREEEKEEVGRPTPGFGAPESSTEESLDEVKELSHQIEHGDIDDPYISSFLTEEQWAEPEITEGPTKTIIGGAPIFSNVSGVAEDAEQDSAGLSIPTESIENEPTLVGDDVLHAEEKKALHSSG